MEYMQKIKWVFDILRSFYLWAKLYECIELILFYTNTIDLQCIDKKVSEICFQLKLLLLYGMKCIIKCFKGNVKYILSKLKQAEGSINCIGVSINWKKDVLSYKHFILKRHLFKPFRIYAVYYFEMQHNSPETCHGDSSDEEQEIQPSLGSQFNASQRSLEVDKMIDRDEVSADKIITEPNAEASAADARRVTSYQEKISSSVQKFFQNFTETNKDYKPLSKSKGNECLQLPDLTDFFKKNLKRKTDEELTPDASKETIFKLPDINLYRNATRRLTRKSLKQIPLGPSSNTKMFLPRRVKKKFDNRVIEKLISEIRKHALYLLKLSTNDEHNVLNIIIARLEEFQPHLKEVNQTEILIIKNLKLIAKCVSMLSFAFSRMNANYDANEFNTIIYNIFHTRYKITTIVGDANDSNDNPNVIFTRILSEIVPVLTCIMQVARPYFNETVSEILGENPHLPKGSGNEDNEDSKSHFERRCVLEPNIYKSARNPGEVKDSHSSLEPSSSDFNSAPISKEESCKTATKEQYINQNVDPTKVKKDHRFQKKFYRKMRELRENAGKKDNDINVSNSKCEKPHLPKGSGLNENSNPDFEHRGILQPKIHECARNTGEVRDSHSSLEPLSSDFNSAPISKEESCKAAAKEHYINQNVDPTKVKKDHRFQKQLYKKMPELRENAETKDNINASDSKELEATPSSSSANETSVSLSPDSIKSGILHIAGTPRSLKEDYP